MSSAFQNGLKQRCPKCGTGRLYSGLLRLNEQCPHCEFDLRESDPGDGPAFFVITFMGFLVTGLAVWVELAYEPVWWLHFLIWLPLTFFGSIYLLRLCKAWLIAYQHRLKIGFRD